MSSQHRSGVASLRTMEPGLEDGAGPSRAAPDATDVQRYPYLASLNPAQLRAVTSPPETPLQILAGPGSGKTRVLTSRVAHLVRHHGYPPATIVCVTFTNKAANEMRKRLEVLLGKREADLLVLGTFHATCARYLRRYGGLIGLANNFSISDADDCKKIMNGLLKAKADVLEGSRMSLKDRAVLSEISKAKAKGEGPDAMAVRALRDPSSSTSTLGIIAELYGEYEAALREANSLDFDDLLVFGLKLFTEAPRVLESCRHILVDEFQDTNTTQYELMRCFAKAHGGVSVVGDPDQSIYGWRSAEVENLKKMTADFTGVEAIYLEQNYRSTGSILAAAHSVVSQDRDRIQKNLFTSHPKSTPVTLKVFSTPTIEASFIATEIKRLVAYSGGVLDYNDFAILLRYNALSRNIESALQKDGIPNRIVGGHKFFERLEVKDLLAYLQLADNSNFTPGFVRVVNVPRRAIGDKSVADLLAAAKAQKISPMELAERIIDGDKLPAGIKPAIKKNLASFVGAVRKIRRAAERGTSVADLLRMVIEKTGYEDYLRTSQPEFESRWENVQELISFSVVVAEEQHRNASLPATSNGFVSAGSEAMTELLADEEAKEEKRLHPMFRRTSSDATSRSGSMALGGANTRSGKSRATRRTNGIANGGGTVKEEAIEIESDEEERENEKHGDHGEGGLAAKDEHLFMPEELSQVNAGMTPLSYFLQTSMLSTDTDSNEKDGKSESTPKVTITTVHAAKGLEWPVVFIPAVEQGTYPSYRCTEAHEVAEERRLLYVAMTRAQVFLTMSWVQYRMTGGEENNKELSEFTAAVQKRDPTMLSTELPEIDLLIRRHVSSMLGRPAPDEEATKDLIRKHVHSAPPLSMWDAPEPQDRGIAFNRFARREVTKATRAAKYWSSEYDEYDLSAPAPPGNRGFKSAREGWRKPQTDGTSSPKAPVVKLPPRNHNLPAPLPFTFNAPKEDAKREADLSNFAERSNASLALMRGLGDEDDLLGDDLLAGFGGGGGGDDSSGGARTPASGYSSPMIGGGAGGAGLGGKGGGSDWKSLATGVGLGMGVGVGVGGDQAAAQGVRLAQGTKRLGMGRPAPWGSQSQAKKPRQQ